MTEFFALFRNPEFKRSVWIYSLLTIVASIVGFCVSVSCGFVVLSVCLIFNSVIFLSAKSRFEKLSDLCFSIDKVLHGDDSVAFSEYGEGELSILQNEISKLTVKLRNQTHNLQKDKVFLAQTLADISHQIRTPLTSINLIVSLLSQPDIPDERRMEITHDLANFIMQIDWLVNALLKMSKLDANTVILKSDLVQVSQVIQKAKDSVEISMELRNQQLIIESNGDETFVGDLLWTAEAISNILKNCMEHMKNNKNINIQVEQNLVYTQIKISDAGEGFDKDDLPHIFERFYKGKNASASSYGIGLALARQIITKQNGTIKAENGLRDGAVFTIRFYKSVI